MKHGIAYHHSGLTNDEKQIIERGFRKGFLFVLVATSTLSTGINLPAKAVILNTPYIAMTLMDSAKYKQMSGRAGRTGFDTKGDSILVCKDQETLNYSRNILLQPFQARLTSAMAGSRLVRALLEIIASQAVNSIAQVGTFIHSTLLFALASVEKCSICLLSASLNQSMFAPTLSADAPAEEGLLFSSFIEKFNLKMFVNSNLAKSPESSKPDTLRSSEYQIDFSEHGVNYSCKNCILEFTKQVIGYLRAKHFLVIDPKNGILPTPLGKAAFASSISPEESARIFDDLE